jgi:hypothetical protein
MLCQARTGPTPGFNCLAVVLWTDTVRDPRTGGLIISFTREFFLFEHYLVLSKRANQSHSSRYRAVDLVVVKMID